MVLTRRGALSPYTPLGGKDVRAWCVLSVQGRGMPHKDNTAYCRERYASDPEFRERRNRQGREYRKRVAADPVEVARRRELKREYMRAYMAAYRARNMTKLSFEDGPTM